MCPISHLTFVPDPLVRLGTNWGLGLDADGTDRVKPFDDLLYFPTTLGMESATDSGRSKLDPEGLCVSRTSRLISVSSLSPSYGEGDSHIWGERGD